MRELNIQNIVKNPNLKKLSNIYIKFFLLTYQFRKNFLNFISKKYKFNILIDEFLTYFLNFKHFFSSLLSACRYLQSVCRSLHSTPRLLPSLRLRTFHVRVPDIYI